MKGLKLHKQRSHHNFDRTSAIQHQNPKPQTHKPYRESLYDRGTHHTLLIAGIAAGVAELAAGASTIPRPPRRRGLAGAPICHRRLLMVAPFVLCCAC